jgi:hypothetical protein
MTEELLYYLWQFRLYKLGQYITQDGQILEIIHPGIRNGDAGPDFFNAKIKIGQTLWAGNVEINLKSSDWKRHGHQKDAAYNNVVLHVVAEDDTEIENASGVVVPAWVMPIEERYLNNYRHLLETSQKISCWDKIRSISNIEKTTWIERMAIEKMEKKVFQITELLNLFQNDWDEVFYILMARNFGFSVNGDVFEQMARQTSWKIVLKNRDKLETLEALFLGQAGFLSGIENRDEYIQKLCMEYNFLKKKYDLKPLSSHLWKFLRLRPYNFPTIRLVQFAKLLHQNNFSLSKISEERYFDNIHDLLMITPSTYWENHFKPGVESLKTEKKVGRPSANLIIVNTLIPILFAYGKLRGKDDLCDKILDWFQKMPSEVNSIISEWKRNDVLAGNAMQSQALIYLYNNYCQHKKCLHCSIGHLVMSIQNGK